MGAFESDNRTGSAWVSSQRKAPLDKPAKNIEFLARPGRPQVGQPQYHQTSRPSQRVSYPPTQAAGQHVQYPARRPSQTPRPSQVRAPRNTQRRESNSGNMWRYIAFLIVMFYIIGSWSV